jgi:hypothetical protein
MTTNPTDLPQEPDAPDLDLIVRAAERLRAIITDPDRSRQDKRHAVDALGSVLARLKRSIR